MNWYKKAQKHMEYQDIAHVYDKIYYIWVIMNGRLYVEPTWEEGTPADHYELWGGDMEDSDYRGRFDPHSKKLSIVNPKEGRPIPNVILRMLYDKFGNDIKIYEFN
jgi:hypothetical protein